MDEEFLNNDTIFVKDKISLLRHIQAEIDQDVVHYGGKKRFKPSATMTQHLEELKEVADGYRNILNELLELYHSYEDSTCHEDEAKDRLKTIDITEARLYLYVMRASQCAGFLMGYYFAKEERKFHL